MNNNLGAGVGCSGRSIEIPPVTRLNGNEIRNPAPHTILSPEITEPVI